MHTARAHVRSTWRKARRAARAQPPVQQQSRPAQSRQPIESQLRRAQALVGAGDLRGACAALAKCTTTDPESVDAAFMHGALCLQLQDHARAAESLRRAVRLDPSAWRASVNLASALSSLAHATEDASPEAALEAAALADEAATHARRALRQQPTLIAAHVVLAQVLRLRGTESRPRGRGPSGGGGASTESGRWAERCRELLEAGQAAADEALRLFEGRVSQPAGANSASPLLLSGELAADIAELAARVHRNCAEQGAATAAAAWGGGGAPAAAAAAAASLRQSWGVAVRLAEEAKVGADAATMGSACLLAGRVQCANGQCVSRSWLTCDLGEVYLCRRALFYE